MLHNHHCPAGPATPDSEHTGEKNSCAKQRKCLFQKGHGNETVGQGFQQLQLIHSESAKVLGLTHQLWHNYELQPDYSNRDYLNLHLQAHAVAFHVHFSIFFPQFHIKDIQFHLHNIRAVWPRGSYATFFFSVPVCILWRSVPHAQQFNSSSNAIASTIFLFFLRI